MWAGPVGDWKQITNVNAGGEARMGRSEELAVDDGYWRGAGVVDLSAGLRSGEEISDGRVCARRAGLGIYADISDAVAISLWAAGARIFCTGAESARELRAGRKFTRANVKDFGYGDFRDIMAGVDEAIKQAPVDPTRLGITGWSYGGFMTMWAVTQTNRFGAAVAGAGLSNYTSYYGENKIDQWMIPYFGARV